MTDQVLIAMLIKAHALYLISKIGQVVIDSISEQNDMSFYYLGFCSRTICTKFNTLVTHANIREFDLTHMSGAHCDYMPPLLKQNKLK